MDNHIGIAICICMFTTNTENSSTVTGNLKQLVPEALESIVFYSVQLLFIMIKCIIIMCLCMYVLQTHTRSDETDLNNFILYYQSTVGNQIQVYYTQYMYGCNNSPTDWHYYSGYRVAINVVPVTKHLHWVIPYSEI